MQSNNLLAESSANKRTPRIALVVYSLGAGGAERVASTLANHWAKANKDVTLVTFDSISTDFYKLDPGVARFSINAAYKSFYFWQIVTNGIRRVRQLRRFLQEGQFDLVLSLGDKTNVQVLMAGLASNLKIIVAEHNDPRKHKLALLPACLRRFTYRKADALVVLTAGMYSWARRIAGHRPVYVIPNPIGQEFREPPQPRRSRGPRRILAMGRLAPQKGFDMLLAAFAQCARRHPSWTLRLIGEGEESLHLRKLARDLKIDSSVEFCPITKEPLKAMQDADFFVLSSRYEGFPMVLLEALASGLPAISFDCLSGPGEMIRDGVNGILVPPNDVPRLAAAMDRLMTSESERCELASHSAEIHERYGIDAIASQWEQIFSKTLGERLTEQHSAMLSHDESTFSSVLN